MTKLTFAGLFAVAAIGAAATGGYLALRHNADDLAAQPQPATTPTAASTPDAATVEPAPAPAAAEAVRPEPARPVAPPTIVPSARPAVPADPTPSITTPAAPAPVTTPPADPVPAPAPPVSPATEAQAPVPPATPAVRYDQVTIPADAVLGLRLDSTLSSETAQIEDKVNARLTRDVMVDGRLALASGARLEGTVTSVERGGKFKDRPRLGFTFHTLVLADNTRVAVHTETIWREGDSPTGQANAKIGGSGVVGAILGGLIGGKKGAIVGGAMGAAGGAAAVASGDRQEVVVTSGTPLTVRLTQPVSLLIERQL